MKHSKKKILLNVFVNNKEVLETDKVKRGQTVGVKDNKGTVRTITVNESTKRLFKKFLNSRK